MQAIQRLRAQQHDIIHRQEAPAPLEYKKKGWVPPPRNLHALFMLLQNHTSGLLGHRK